MDTMNAAVERPHMWKWLLPALQERASDLFAEFGLMNGAASL